MTWAIHLTLATRRLEPLETDPEITPYLVYAMQDALVKPMPGQPQRAMSSGVVDGDTFIERRQGQIIDVDGFALSA
jgi:hypothetical protein